MAWDFETEPEFEEQLAWMREFVREEIFPIETLELPTTTCASSIAARSRTRCSDAGCGPRTCRPSSAAWASARCGSASCTRSSASRPTGRSSFGNNAPDSGNAELLAVGMEMTGRDDIRERWLEPLLAGDDPLGVLDDRAATPRAATRSCSRRAPCVTATSGSSTGASGTRRTARSPTSSS